MDEEERYRGQEQQRPLGESTTRHGDLAAITYCAFDVSLVNDVNAALGNVGNGHTGQKRVSGGGYVSRSSDTRNLSNIAGSFLLCRRGNRGRCATFSCVVYERISGLGNTAEPKLGRILVAAKHLYDLANCDRGRMSGHTGQKQDTENGCRGAKSSTDHGLEFPPE
jgi:hypothetical protein